MKFTGINLLDELEREEMAHLRSVFRERRFGKGAVIYTPDEAEDLVFIIAEGRVRVYLAYADKEFTVGILGPGDLYSTHAECYVQAFEETRLLTTDVQSVKRCMAEVPLFTRTMVRVLGQILKNSFSIIGGLVFKDIQKRLADYLLAEARQSGVPEGGGLVVRLDLTAEQLARLMGATRQTISTLINDMIREGLVERRSRGEFFIPDPQALERAAGEN